ARDTAPGGHRRSARDRQAFSAAEVLAIHQRDPGRRAQGTAQRGVQAVRRALGGALLTWALCAVAAGDELAVYRAQGSDVNLFDQNDNDGYSLAVAPGPDGGIELRVRVSGQPLSSRSPF